MDHKIITILVEDVWLDAELFESATAEKITAALPFEGTATRWGGEIYFTIPVTTGQEPDARVEVDDGELAYWPAGNAFWINFGPTPTSKDDKPRAYSPVNVFGRILGDATALKRIAEGARIRVVQKLDPGATSR